MMGMSRCYAVMKCLLILFNTVFLVVGAGVCMFCAWCVWEGGAGDTPQARAGLAVLAAWGAALALAAVAALAGACRGSAGLLAGAFALLALTAVAEAAAVWWGARHGHALRVALGDRLALSVRREYGHVHAHTQAVDAIQRGLRCCGAEGVRDWRGSEWSRRTEGGESAGGGSAGEPLDLSVLAEAAYYWAPGSCCAEGAAECEGGAVRVAAGGGGGGAGLHTAGCTARVLAALERWSRVPLAVGAGLLAAHALALLLALALCLQVHPRRRYKA